MSCGIVQDHRVQERTGRNLQYPFNYTGLGQCHLYAAIKNFKIKKSEFQKDSNPKIKIPKSNPKISKSEIRNPDTVSHFYFAITGV